MRSGSGRSRAHPTPARLPSARSTGGGMVLFRAADGPRQKHRGMFQKILVVLGEVIELVALSIEDPADPLFPSSMMGTTISDCVFQKVGR